MKCEEMTKEYIYGLFATLYIDYKVDIYSFLLDNNLLELGKFMAWVRFKDYISKQQYLEFIHTEGGAGIEIFQSYDTDYSLIPYNLSSYCDREDLGCLYMTCDLKIKSIIAEYFDEVEDDKAELLKFIMQNKPHYLHIEMNPKIRSYSEIANISVEGLKKILSIIN